MSDATGDRLYNLLPAVYRLRDAAEGQPLRALLGVIEGELDRVDEDIRNLYDNWFIETCDEWVVPYIGDLLGVRGLLSVPGATFSQRALVADTLALRQGKGTGATLEQLSRDLTGWPARVVESFLLLATTQFLNHVRPGNLGTVNLRDANQLELIDTPFESATHTADLRHIDNGRGKYNIPDVGIFLWRLQPYLIEGVTARAVPASTPAQSGRFTFSPLGLDTPLFNTPIPEPGLDRLIDESHAPAPLRRRPLHDELEARRAALANGLTPADSVYFGVQPTLRVWLDGVEVLPEEIAIGHLGDPPPTFPVPEGWQRPLPTKSYPTAAGASKDMPILVAVDPVLGRIALPSGASAKLVEVSYSYGFPGDLGGGPYIRALPQGIASLPASAWRIDVAGTPPAGDMVPTVTTLGAAIAAWKLQPPGKPGIITVRDSRTYAEDIALAIPSGSQLAIVAAPSRRPHLKGQLTVSGSALAGEIDAGTLAIDGFLIEGGLTITSGNLGGLGLAHTTLAPASGGLTVADGSATGLGNDALVITIERCVTGPIRIAETVSRLSLKESIIDGLGSTAIVAPATEIDSCTILGSAQVRSIEASNSIFNGVLTVKRRQTGCVRFCYLPIGSIAPRRFRCLPGDQAAGATSITPQFTSVAYGNPAYGQLSMAGPEAIRSGADDGDELGAFHFLSETRRRAALEARLAEFLRFRMEAGTFTVN